MDFNSLGQVAGVVGYFAGSALVAFFLRFNGLGKYYRGMQKKIETAAFTPGETVLSLQEERSAQVLGDPLAEFEARLNEKMHHLETRVGCSFSEIFQKHLQCAHDLIANRHLTTKDLIDAIDDQIAGMAQLSAILKKLNGRLAISDEDTQKDLNE